MHKQLSLALRLMISNLNFFENSMKPDINSIEDSVDPDQLASEGTNFQLTCKVKLINPI